MFLSSVCSLLPSHSQSIVFQCFFFSGASNTISFLFVGSYIARSVELGSRIMHRRDWRPSCPLNIQSAKEVELGLCRSYHINRMSGVCVTPRGVAVGCGSAMAFDKKHRLLYTSGRVAGNNTLNRFRLRIDRGSDWEPSVPSEDEAESEEEEKESFPRSPNQVKFILDTCLEEQEGHNFVNSIVPLDSHAQVDDNTPSLMYCRFGSGGEPGSFHFLKGDSHEEFELRKGSMFCCSSNPRQSCKSTPIYIYIICISFLYDRCLLSWNPMCIYCSFSSIHSPPSTILYPHLHQWFLLERHEVDTSLTWRSGNTLVGLRRLIEILCVRI